MGDEEYEFIPVPPTYPMPAGQQRGLGYTESDLELKTKLLDINIQELISKEMAVSNLRHYELPYLKTMVTLALVCENFENKYPDWGFEQTRLLFLAIVDTYHTLARSRDGFERKMIATNIQKSISEQSFIQKGRNRLFGGR